MTPATQTKPPGDVDHGSTDRAAPPEDYGRSQAWTAAFRLTNVNETRGFALSQKQQTQILTSLAGTAAVLTRRDYGFSVTFNVNGSFDSAVAKGTEQLWSALEAADLEGFAITNARLVNHADFDAVEDDEQPVLFGISECAMALELSKQRISQLVHAGDFPSPDAYVGKRPAWKQRTIDTFRKKRKSTQAA